MHVMQVVGTVGIEGKGNLHLDGTENTILGGASSDLMIRSAINKRLWLRGAPKACT